MKSFGVSTLDRIDAMLTAAFAPTHLEVRDFSAQHRSHAAAKAHGGGHYAITIVAEYFCGMGPLQRHRLIYQALRKEMHERIHALTMAAYTADEWQRFTTE